MGFEHLTRETLFQYLKIPSDSINICRTLIRFRPVIQNYVQLLAFVFPTLRDFIQYLVRHVKRPSNGDQVKNGFFYTKQAPYIATEVWN